MPPTRCLPNPDDRDPRHSGRDDPVKGLEPDGRLADRVFISAGAFFRGEAEIEIKDRASPDARSGLSRARCRSAKELRRRCGESLRYAVSRDFRSIRRIPFRTSPSRFRRPGSNRCALSMRRTASAESDGRAGSEGRHLDRTFMIWSRRCPWGRGLYRGNTRAKAGEGPAIQQRSHADLPIPSTCPGWRAGFGRKERQASGPGG